MTQMEIAKKIASTGNCSGIACAGDHCPLYDKPCGRGSISGIAEWAKEWMKSNGGTMNKSEAISRLDAIEKEQAELRKIIEKGDKIVYDITRLYVAIYKGDPYILAGDGTSRYFRFHTFGDYNMSEQGWSSSNKTGQECIDYHLSAGFDIHVFDDTKEALQFFIDHL